MENFAGQYGYLGIFLIRLVGSTSIFFPIPYTVVIFTAANFLNPLMNALESGLGSAIEEFSGYLLGLGGRLIIAYSARYTITIIREIFGIESDWIAALVSMMLAIILLIIVLAIIFKVN
jgi:hypothetical protein